MAASAIAGTAGNSTQSAADVRTFQFSGYTIEIEHTEGTSLIGQDLLTVRRAGALIYRLSDARIQFATAEDPDADLPEALPISTEAPQDIVVQSFSGGAHCCYTVEILSLGDKFEASPPLDIDSAGVSLFKLPHDNSYGLETTDGTFSYWWTSFADSPQPELVLRYDRASRRFRFVRELMRKPPLTRDQLDASAEQIRSDNLGWSAAGDLVNPDYVRAVIELVYTGDFAGARVLAFKGWPNGKPGLNKFVKDLYACALPSSQWWFEVAKLNGIKPYPKSAGCKWDS